MEQAHPHGRRTGRAWCPVPRLGAVRNAWPVALPGRVRSPRLRRRSAPRRVHRAPTATKLRRRTRAAAPAAGLPADALGESPAGSGRGFGASHRRLRDRPAASLRHRPAVRWRSSRPCPDHPGWTRDCRDHRGAAADHREQAATGRRQRGRATGRRLPVELRAGTVRGRPGDPLRSGRFRGIHLGRTAAEQHRGVRPRSDRHRALRGDVVLLGWYGRAPPAADPPTDRQPVAGVILQVDPRSAVPPYEQIRVQITGMIANGVLPAGTRLPPIRQLAKDLGLAGGTVARAYRELEADGSIATRGHRGSHVMAPPEQPTSPRVDEALASAARAFALQARQLGADAARALRLAEQAFDALET
ncbi:MAG: GntR family transcriptional regulator [Geodermatophilaceae bacterium]|nr:GntR family transcriptional regulator [Geodermatophilaceae bacterium]